MAKKKQPLDIGSSVTQVLNDEQFAVRVNAYKTMIPTKTGMVIANYGDIITDPTDELLDICARDEKNNVFSLIKV